MQRIARFPGNFLIKRFSSSSVPVKPTPKPIGAVYEAEVLSGVPDEVTQRSVRIFRPSKSAMQSGTGSAEDWRIDFDTNPRWQNELMGWSSSADTVQALRLKFESREDAIRFAERQGYRYRVDEPKDAKFKVKSYSANFKYNPKKLTWFHTK